MSPDYIPEVVEACVKRDVMCVPGGIGDVGKQLVRKATLYNLDLDELRIRHPYQWVYKLFPAMVGGDGHLKMARAWKSVYKNLTVVYTGGVNRDNVAGIVETDPEGIVCGSALTKHPDDVEAMTEEGRWWLTAMAAARRGDAVGNTKQRTVDTSTAPALFDEFDQGETAPAEPEKTTSEKKEEIPVERIRVAGTTAPSPGSDGRCAVTFGEIMLRLSPPAGQRFSQMCNLDAIFGGAESNVAVALSQLGTPARFVTALPHHDLGQAAVNALRGFGVDTSAIVRCGDRVGIYFLEHGASQRPSRVIYDRAHSALADLEPGRIDWDAAMKGAAWFHWTGITPALSDAATAETRNALEAARRAGAKVSVDLNYRARLWSKERAREVMTSLMPYVDVIVANEADAEDVFGIRSGTTDVEAGKLDLDGYRRVADELRSRFGFKAVAITLRESLSASDNAWSACLLDDQGFHVSRKYVIHLVDRVGGGDAFAAGLIHGFLEGRSGEEALEFGVAASCLKQTIQGDFNLVTSDEVEALMGGSGSGRIKR